MNPEIGKPYTVTEAVVRDALDRACDIVEGCDRSRDIMQSAENLAVFAVRHLVGERRDVALRLAGALADYAALDAEDTRD